MEYQNTISPEPYSPMKILKRETRWEQIFDVDGSLWNVREARATKHGFDLLFGIPANSGISPRDIGPKRLIATPALVTYWEVNRTNEGAVNDLPAGRSTLKRIRKRLRFDFFQDRRNLWKKRRSEPTGLRKLQPRLRGKRTRRRQIRHRWKARWIAWRPCRRLCWARIWRRRWVRALDR